MLKGLAPGYIWGANISARPLAPNDSHQSNMQNTCTPLPTVSIHYSINSKPPRASRIISLRLSSHLQNPLSGTPMMETAIAFIKLTHKLTIILLLGIPHGGQVDMSRHGSSGRWRQRNRRGPLSLEIVTSENQRAR